MAITTTIITRGLPRRLAGPEAWKKIAAMIVKSCIVPFAYLGPAQHRWGRNQPGGFYCPAVTAPDSLLVSRAGRPGQAGAALEESRTLFRPNVQAGPTA